MNDQLIWILKQQQYRCLMSDTPKAQSFVKIWADLQYRLLKQGQGK